MAMYITNTAARQEQLMQARLRKYGITPTEYAKMRDRQGNRCAICERHASHSKELVVDHDHATNAVRSLLCGHCNTALGMMTDNAAHLRRAADYLEQHGSKPKARGTGEELHPVRRVKVKRSAVKAERASTDQIVDEAGDPWCEMMPDLDEYDLMAERIS